MSSIAAFMVLGGSAYAATALKANSVGASQIKTGAVRSSEVKNGWLLSKDFKPGQLKAGPAGATGPAGAPGATGATGATGAAGAKGDKGDKGDSATTLWAVGNPDGTVARSSGHLGTGTGKVVTRGYQVIFDRDITGCAYLATAGNPGSATPASSYAEVAQRGGNANGVYITTRTDAGTQADQGFHVAVFC